MLTSPITITYDGAPKSLSRINQDNFSAVYFLKEAGKEFRLTIRHAYEKATPVGQMERHNVDLQVTVWNEDGIPTTTQSYTVIRTKRGDTVDAGEDATKALNTFVTANVVSLIGWES